jgi:hypothetical protein
MCEISIFGPSGVRLCLKNENFYLVVGFCLLFAQTKSKIRKKINDKLQQQLLFKYYIIKAYELSICLN